MTRSNVVTATERGLKPATTCSPERSGPLVAAGYSPRFFTERVRVEITGTAKMFACHVRAAKTVVNVATHVFPRTAAVNAPSTNTPASTMYPASVLKYQYVNDVASQNAPTKAANLSSSTDSHNT